MTNAKAPTNAAPLRYRFTTHICTACRTRYAMPDDDLCGACAEEAEDGFKGTRCIACNAINGHWQKRPNGHTTRIQVLSNGYCRKCFEARKAGAR